MNSYADSYPICEVDSINPSTGVLVQSSDSVLIAYDDLRIVNSKLIELEYQKEINYKLNTIIKNDSIVIENHKQLYNRVNKDCKKAIKERNIAIGVGSIFLGGCIILLVK